MEKKKNVVKKPSSKIFENMEKVTVYKSYEDRTSKMYLDLQYRILFKSALVMLLGIISYVMIYQSFSLETVNEVSYNENANVNYKVKLKENDYYDKEYLTSEDYSTYLSSLIDDVEIDYSYYFNLAKKMDFNYSYEINSTLYINSYESGKNLYQVKKNNEPHQVVKGSNNTIDLKKNVIMDYDDYNNLAMQYRKDNSNVNIKAYVDVVMKVSYNGDAKVFMESKNKTTTMKVRIPLTEPEVSITKNIKDSNKDSKFSEVSSSELVNDVFLGFGVAAMIGAAISFIELFIFIDKVRPKKSKYCKVRDSYLKNYNHVIVDSKKVIKLDDYKVIDCKDFNELFDAQQTLDKPIVYYEIVRNQKAMFVILNGDEAYKYVLKECDLDK